MCFRMEKLGVFDANTKQRRPLWKALSTLRSARGQNTEFFHSKTHIWKHEFFRKPHFTQTEKTIYSG